MADEIRLSAQTRNEFGKGAARRIRRASMIPAVVYGHGEAPRHVTLPGHATMLAVKRENAVLTIDVEGEEVLALVKDVQREHRRREIEHVDLVLVRHGEKVEVEVAVHVEGEAAPETVVTVDHQTLLVEVDALRIPESVTVSVEGAEPGTQVLASQVALPDGATLVTDPEALVVNVSAARTAEDLDADLAEAESELGIERDESDADAEAGAAPATSDES
ncbi:50S ribosomal protein L25/general stress protein Ctc [Pseudokineococcus marinus]|uniref:Large ribosomal subunit protein bL25 n=1 Tax=Pseudokineococcus marinus TaxID=351215 RepID=A0A849BK09_9ACTN|nr:50S ribosomal protein L25/general stress protein Ctc [Pseudokineococcus marinus]NNH21695.1 50S ribosomal protein L25/general stress protein Ctc [Pseudokineococcus marinus]